MNILHIQYINKKMRKKGAAPTWETQYASVVSRPFRGICCYFFFLFFINLIKNLSKFSFYINIHYLFVVRVFHSPSSPIFTAFLHRELIFFHICILFKIVFSISFSCAQDFEGVGIMQLLFLFTLFDWNENVFIPHMTHNIG